MDVFLNLASVWKALETDPTTVSDPVKRTFLFDGEHLTVNIASGADAGNSLHTQPLHDEVIVVLEGEAEFRVGEQTRRVSVGDIVFIPRNTLHGRTRTYSDKWAALSIYGPAFDRRKKNIIWKRDQEP